MDDSLSTQLDEAIRSGHDPLRLTMLCVGRLRTVARGMLRRHPAVRSRADTDDLLQNAAIRLHRALGRVVVETPRHALALAVVQLRRELVDLLRALRPSDRRGDPAERRREVADWDESLLGWEEFHAAVDSLPQPEREAVQMLWYMGLPQDEAARLLGISDRSLRRRWKQARETLRARLSADDFHGRA